MDILPLVAFVAVGTLVVGLVDRWLSRRVKTVLRREGVSAQGLRITQFATVTIEWGKLPTILGVTHLTPWRIAGTVEEMNALEKAVLASSQEPTAADVERAHELFTKDSTP